MGIHIECRPDGTVWAVVTDGDGVRSELRLAYYEAHGLADQAYRAVAESQRILSGDRSQL